MPGPRGPWRTGLVLPLAMLLAGCPVPIPPGFDASSRENLDVEVIERLEVGVTTREEVLVTLGEPDALGAGQTWIAYGSAYGRGGVLFVFCGGGDCAGAGTERREYRRLVVTFDDRGVVADAEFVTLACWETLLAVGSTGARSPPCLKVVSPDADGSPATDAVQARPPVPVRAPLPDDLVDFARGHAELVTPGWFSGYAEAATAAGHAALRRGLHEGGDWQELARTTLRDGYGDDLGWYHLGRAAEGLGYCDAASVYYGISETMSERFVTRCLGPTCGGIALPGAIEERKAAIDALRAEGHCVEPPGR